MSFIPLLSVHLLSWGHLRIYLSINLFIYPTIYLSIFLSIYLSFYLSISIYIILAILNYMYVSKYFSVYLFSFFLIVPVPTYYLDLSISQWCQLHLDFDTDLNLLPWQKYIFGLPWPRRPKADQALTLNLPSLLPWPSSESWPWSWPWYASQVLKWSGAMQTIARPWP